jgi:hypothetical protein
MDFALSTLTFPWAVRTLFPSNPATFTKRAMVACPSHDTLPSAKSRPGLAIDHDRCDHHHRRHYMKTTRLHQPLHEKTLIDRESEEESEEDDTASVVSSSCCSSSSSSSSTLDGCPMSLSRTASTASSSTRRVSFPDQPVTAIYTRPTTTPEEHYWLHYTNFDFIDFKLSYWTGVDRTRKVSFSYDLVTETQLVTPWSQQEKQLLYYSEQDLQRFLDDFVRSLR